MGRVLDAVLRERADEVREALRAGEIVEDRDEAGRTPLTHAAIDGLGEITRILLDASADPRTNDFLGMTPLHYAVQGSHIEVVRLLLAAGADPNARDQRGNSPTHRAVFHSGGSADAAMVLRLLAQAGSDFDAPNASGISARDLARTMGLDLDGTVRGRGGERT